MCHWQLASSGYVGYRDVLYPGDWMVPECAVNSPEQLASESTFTTIDSPCSSVNTRQQNNNV